MYSYLSNGTNGLYIEVYTHHRHRQPLGKRGANPHLTMADEDAGGFAAFMATVDRDNPQQMEAKPTDEYHYEERQEKEAMMKSYHHPMKQWFRQKPQLEVRALSIAIVGWILPIAADNVIISIM